MKSRNWSKPDTEDEKESAPKSVNGMCMCYGCPMWGSVSRSTTKSDDWMCGPHSQVEATDWAEVTLRLKQHILIVSLIQDIRKMQNGHEIDMRGWLVSLKTNGFESYLPNNEDRRHNGKLSGRKWLGRVSKQLTDAVTQNLTIHSAGDDKAAPQTHLEMVMDLVDEWLKRHQMKAAA